MNVSRLLTKTVYRNTFACFFALLLSATAEAKDILRWGADGQGGAPHVFYDPKNPKRLTGFEYEVAKNIADFTGKDLQYCPNDYEMLVSGLKRGEYDILMNAIVRNVWQKHAKQADILLSDPYYVTHLQPVVLKNSEIKTVSQLKGKKIGILKCSEHAENAVRQLGAHFVIYDDEVKAYADLNNKRLDCVMTDHPETFYYASVDDSIRMLEPVDRIEFSVAVRDDHPDLLKQVNAALEHLKSNGTLRAIYERWGLWNAETATYFKTSAVPQTPATELERYIADVRSGTENGNCYLNSLSYFTKAAAVTLGISLSAMVLALVFGFILAVFRTYGFRWLQCLTATWIEIIRGTPLMVQLLFIFYGLPNLAPYLSEPFASWVCMNPFVAGILALGLNYSAYEAEIYRSGFQSVPVGQTEAARALGMTHTQALWHVVFPQAVRTVLPPLTNDFIMLLQDSSLVSLITIVELSRTYQLFAAANFNYFGFGILVSLFYLLMGLPFTRLARYFEKALSARMQRQA